MTAETDQRPPRTPPRASRWLIVILLAVIATCLLIEVGFGSRPATAAPGQAGAADPMFAVAGQITRTTYGMYLVDVRRGTICLYEYVSATKKLHLRAARNVTFDLQLDAYNTEISPHQVKALVEQHRRLKTKPEP